MSFIYIVQLCSEVLFNLIMLKHKALPTGN